MHQPSRARKEERRDSKERSRSSDRRRPALSPTCRRDRQRSLGLFGVKGGILAKTVNSENSSELLINFIYFLLVIL